MDDWNRKAIEVEFYNIFVPATILQYFILHKDYHSLVRISRLTLIFIFITSLMSIYSSYIDPLYARSLTGGRYTEQEFIYFNRLGGGGYSFAIVLMSILPILIYFYKFKSKSVFSKITIFILISLFYYTLIRMQIVANILLASIVAIVAILGRKRIRSTLTVLSIFFILVLTVPKIYYAKMFKYVGGYFNEKSENYYKFNDMASFIINKNKAGITEERIARYPELVKSFLNSPLLGASANRNKFYKGRGAHLYWMNRLTIWGLVGFVFYIYIHYYYIEKSIKYFNKITIFYFLLAIGSILIYGFLKNIAGRDTWYAYFLIIPGFYFSTLLNINLSNKWWGI